MKPGSEGFMSSIYRLGFFLFALMAILGFAATAPSREDSLINGLVRNQDAWNITFSPFDSRFDPRQTKPRLVEFLEKKRRSTPVDSLIAGSVVASFFCLIGWRRERKLVQRKEAGSGLGRRG